MSEKEQTSRSALPLMPLDICRSRRQDEFNDHVVIPEKYGGVLVYWNEAGAEIDDENNRKIRLPYCLCSSSV